MTKILIEAGPGSGKTTTLTNTHKYLLTGLLPSKSPSQEQYIIMETIRSKIKSIHAQQAVFACMTNAGKDDLETKVARPTRVFTYNGLGASILIRAKRHQAYDGKRGKKILEAVTGQRFEDMPYKARREHWAALKYLQYCKEELLQPTDDNIYFIQQKYGLETSPPEDLGVLQRALERMAKIDGTVEWIDQIWLALQNIHAPVYEIGYVDECQDLSNLKLLFMLKACRHIIFCGDPYQSINGFAGADYNVFNKVINLSEQVLPLKTCFRCPVNHIEHANTIRPARIKPFKMDRVPDKSVSINDLGDYVRENSPEGATHLMIARLNSILLRVGIKLTKQGISCHIMSRSNENSIQDIIEQYIKRTGAKTISQLVSIAVADAENSKKLGFQAGTLAKDRTECILELANECETIPQLKDKLFKLTQASGKSIPLATIHKSKGLEADYVYILFPPVQLRADTQDQQEQEVNLEFVAETRSRHQKVYVRE